MDMQYFKIIVQCFHRVPRKAAYLAGAAMVLLAMYVLKTSSVAVVAYTVQQGEMAAEVMGTGTLEAKTRVTVSSKISGLLSSVPVDQGDAVRAGQLIARLDDNELKQQVAIAEATLAAVRASEVRLQAEVKRAAIIVDQRRRDNDRNQKLFAGRAIADTDAEKSSENFNIAEAELVRAESALQEMYKQLIVANTTLDYHRARLADTVIVAPFDGLIVKRLRDAGDIIVPGSAIFTLIALDELWVSAWIDETQMSGLAPGQTAQVVFRSDPETAYPGTVARLGREADRETREFIIDVRVARLPRQWAVGQRGEVFIETARRQNAVMVPLQALAHEAGVSGVYVIRKGKAVWQAARTGLRNRQQVEVLDGPAPGEMVIRLSDMRSKKLLPGSRVKVTRQ